MRWVFWASGLGAALSWVAMVSYFLVVVPRWSNLRDSGLLNIMAACLGLLLSCAALGWSLHARKWRVAPAVLTVVALLPTALLTLYVHVFSYWLPDTRGVVAVGQAAPALDLPDQDGQVRRLAKLAGQRVVLVFFRGHW